MVMSIVTLCLTVTTLIILSTKLNDITYIETTTPILPNSYVIPENRITPVSGQLARGTCWIFATISLVESAFRKAAIDNKMIKSNEYIALSDQAYGKLMLQLCNGTYGDVPDEVSSFCEDGGMAKGKTDDGEIEWAYYFRNYNNKFFYPISVCPYTTRRGETDWDCDGVDLKNPTKQTPITVNVKGLNSKYTPSSIKQLINDTQGPVGWGHATLGRTYMYPCDGKSPYSNGQDCLEQRFPCNGGFCTKVSTLSFGYDGIFRLNGEPTNRGGHAMNIVGWNDEYLGGGFIIKNSWTSQSGHSLGYFMGNHSLFNEDQICPTYNSINKWIPMGADCFKNNQDPEACPNITRTLLGNPLKGATVLKCTSSNSVSEVASEKAKDYGFYPCSTEEGKAYYYTLEASDDVNASPYVPKVEYPEGTDGYAIFNLIRWLPNGESSFEKIQTNYTTWQFMERLFTPSNIQNFMNSEHCGYYFMSYDVFLEHDLRHPLGGHDTYVFSSVDLNFDSKSFNNKADYKDSTFEYQLPTFTGSLDFN
ncbi:Peptidase C1A papain C-terminal domain-containing protein [Entamoeba marina]